MSNGRKDSDDYQLGRAGYDVSSLSGLAGLEARKAAEAEEKFRRPMRAPGGGPANPVRNVVQLAALAVAAYVWHEAARRGSDSAPMYAGIALVVSLVVFSLPPFRWMFYVLAGALKIALVVGLFALGCSYAKHIGLL